MVSNWGRTRREKKKGREEEKEKKKRKKEDSSQDQAKVWNFGFLVWKFTLIMNSMRFGMVLWVCMMIILLKPRVLLEFHLSPKIMESKVGKTPYGTRWLWNPSFEDGFMVNCK